MKYWYDTEFYEDGKQIHLISIGIVAEDGRELYIENENFHWDIVPADHWIWENVYPHLDFNIRRGGATLSSQVRAFLTQNGTEFNNELWGYYSAYDHVVLAQIFGKMVDMPEGVPWFTQDIRQLKEMLKNEGWYYDFPKQESIAHNALNDARWTKLAYEDIMKFAQEDW